MTTKRKPTRRGGAASARGRKTHEIKLSEAIAYALTTDLRNARDSLLDIQAGEGDADRHWLSVLSTLRTLEIVLLTAMAQVEVDRS